MSAREGGMLFRKKKKNPDSQCYLTQFFLEEGFETLKNLGNVNPTCAKHKTVGFFPGINKWMWVLCLFNFHESRATYNYFSALPHESFELSLHVKIYYLTFECVNTTLGTLKEQN